MKNAEDFLEKHPKWIDGLHTLRSILLDLPLKEEIKWGAPTYVADGNNLVMLVAFNSYFGLWFVQGALLSDPQNVLVNAQAGKTKAQRQWRFHGIGEIDQSTVRKYIEEAIRNSRAGKAIPVEILTKDHMPEELADALKDDADLKRAFDELTPGRRREYATYISEAKRSPTRKSRTQKCVPLIRAGKGLNDQYR